jgi:hypothetical protein
MKLTELKNWLAQLPAEFNEYSVVNAEFGEMNTEDESFTYRLDKPVLTVVVNEESSEILILNAPTKENIEEDVFIEGSDYLG